MNTPTMKPCPCCGESKKLLVSHGTHWDRKSGLGNAECLRCGLGVFVEAKTEEAAARLAVKRWNRREEPRP